MVRLREKLRRLFMQSNRHGRSAVMNKRQVLLAALATGGTHRYTPVQLQKLLFLIDRNVADLIGGPFYDFQPYAYGPFDATVYSDVRDLELDGDAVEVLTGRAWTCYSLTDEGVRKGREFLAQLPESTADYFQRVGEFVRRLSFSQLVASIYEAYPEMAVKSVFREDD